MMKAALILLLIFTITYIVAVVYANNNIVGDGTGKTYGSGKIYSATLYLGEPDEWYNPEELGIIQIMEEENTTSLAVSIPTDLDSGDLGIKHPIFKYNDGFYQIGYAEACWDAGLPESVKQWQFPIGATLGIGWLSIGMLFLRRRKNERTT